MTTLDINIQDVAEHLWNNTRANTMRIMDAGIDGGFTGAIKAIANLSRNKDGDYVENFHYAIAEASGARFHFSNWRHHGSIRRRTGGSQRQHQCWQRYFCGISVRRWKMRIHRNLQSLFSRRLKVLPTLGSLVLFISAT